VRKSL
ncbi:hypothetical protein D047_5086B, partial [Vibrio parahaemolyticus VPTS-2010_2]|jgi:hypothetical protein